MGKGMAILICALIVVAGNCVLIKKDVNENAVQNNNVYSEKIEISKGDENVRKIKLKINDEELTATLEKNSSADALVEELNNDNIVIEMHDYGNFEKVGNIGTVLPRNDENYTTKPGDIILYQGNQITIYYDTNTWSFTKLGEIDDISQEELKKILGEGNVTVELEKMDIE